MHNFMYIVEGKSSLYKNTTILPTKSFVTSEVDATKENEVDATKEK